MKTEKNSLNAVFLRLYCAIIVTTYILCAYEPQLPPGRPQGPAPGGPEGPERGVLRSL